VATSDANEWEGTVRRPSDWPDDGDPLVGLLSSVRPDTPPARPEFEARLRARFLAGARQGSGATERDAETVRAAGTPHGPAGAHAAPRRHGDAWRTGRVGPVWPGLRAAVWPVAAAAAAVTLALAVGYGQGHLRTQAGPGTPAAPAPMSRSSLLAANARAWAGIEDMSGRFETDDGRRWEEWVAMEGGNVVRFRRYIDGPPIAGGVQEQWNISDGVTEWLVDGATATVVATSEFTQSTVGDLQCEMLRLPLEAADGAEPSPGQLDGRPVYRLEVHAQGRLRVYWLDALDMLVYRVDDEHGATLWRRSAIEINPGLSPDEFTWSNLQRS